MRTLKNVTVFALTTIAVSIPAMSQTTRSSRPPSLSTEEVAARRIAPRALRSGAITELHILTESDSELDEKDLTLKGDDCLFELPDNPAKYFDRNDDGEVDYLEVRIKCPQRQTELVFSTDKMGFNIIPGSYVGAMHPSTEPRTGRPGFYISLATGCSRSGVGSFRIHEAEFDLSGSVPALVSFAASFEQNCTEYREKKIKGTFYYNAVPVKQEPQPLAPAKKGQRKAGASR
jgi:hypothetical protein